MKRALLMAIVFAACRTGSVVDRNPYAGHPDAVQAGAKLYRYHCAHCHGANAEGRVGPPLGTDSVRDRSDGALFRFVTNGDLRRGMPSWSRLPDQRRWQIIAYLRSLHSTD